MVGLSVCLSVCFDGNLLLCNGGELAVIRTHTEQHQTQQTAGTVYTLGSYQRRS